MDENDIRGLLQAGLGDCDLALELEGNKLFLRLVGDVFEGLSRVKRSQLVYGLLNEKISSGEIHAVSMRCQTRNEASESS
ncbi:MAG: BolA/IbaG family iron-sulfur metabolism protein [Pseudomonadales bacterium]|nr:BolA/IbaG family iron-sulfur metabolism protein [Pseudomonadales bacterium]